MALNILKNIEINEKNLNEKLNLLPNSLKRKTPKVFQLAYLAAREAILDLKKPQAIICVSPFGCLDETVSFLDKLHDTNFGSPKDFVFSVHNSLGAMLAKEFEILGPNLTMAADSVDFAEFCAEILEEKIVLLVYFNDKNEFAQKVLEKCGKERQGGSFAVALLCEKTFSGIL
ncbi:MAG: beta-ketoacyl synthase chain length factor [Chitinispirillales bacterium]|jgi:hypothetical protein|nr:beta-ketoacyl synthase chain length factor [Chitinispirillales bacterium]